MSTLILTILAALGLNYIVVEGGIFGWLRSILLRLTTDSFFWPWMRSIFQWFLDLITCTQCFGFWSGILIELVSCCWRTPLAGPWWCSAVLVGFATSGVAVIMRKLERH